MTLGQTRFRVRTLLSIAHLTLGLQACGGRGDGEVLQGQVEVRKVNVSSKIAGRLDSVLVREGDIVSVGQLVAVLRSPELAAKAEQASGSVDAALAQQSKAQHGARVQEISAARANWQRAVEAEKLAATTFERMHSLFLEGVVVEQRHDEAETQSKAARLTSAAAKAGYDLALAGARSEDRNAASALVRQARGGQAEVESFISETRIRSPIAGEISQRTVESGEIVAAGIAIVTVADLTDAWVTFNVREDRLSRIGMDTILTVKVPALGNMAIAVKVSFISPVGDFATWRSTGETGGFDLRTFEVRARPAAKVDGLRPGMTVLLAASALGAPGQRRRN
jgi:HlyD family secretion protein